MKVIVRHKLTRVMTIYKDSLIIGIYPPQNVNGFVGEGLYQIIGLKFFRRGNLTSIKSTNASDYAKEVFLSLIEKR